jgi:hypothetical protein
MVLHREFPQGFVGRPEGRAGEKPCRREKDQEGPQTKEGTASAETFVKPPPP